MRLSPSTLAALLPFALQLASFPAFAQSPQKGIEPADLDISVPACENFFDYANGGWRKENPIPPSMSRWSRRWASGELAKDQLRTILDEISASDDWPQGSIEQQIGDNYAACMNEPEINALGTKPVQPMLERINAIGNASQLQAVLGELLAINIRVPFVLSPTSDPHNPSQVIADLGAGGLGLPDRDYYLKPEARFTEAREKYLGHVARMFELTGLGRDQAQANALTVMGMETALAKASLDNVSLRNPENQDHPTTFAGLQELAPDFDWSAYFSNAGIAQSDLNVSEPAFLVEFNRQLTAVPLTDWKVYLQWQLLNSAADSLATPLVEESFAFFGAYLEGAQELKPRWKRCVESTDELLGEALGQKYVERYFPPEAKARMEEMVHNLRLAMKDVINGLDWMSPATKEKALEKLSTFYPKIGYPSQWKDYSDVEISRTDYWQDVMAGRRFVIGDALATIGKPVDRERWGMTPPTSNAYYNPLLNEIVFPAGILQPPAFDMAAVDAVNYGAIGVVIGHEISHGFDDQGSQFDAQGRLNNWWTEADLAQFQQRSQCVIDQFESYEIEPGLHHNGKLVLGESIGDLAGAKIAFLAYQLSREGKPPAPVIDGFTPEQQFFISWGQWRGDAIRPETQRMMIQGDPHPIAKYRVIGPLSNLPAFQQAFACADQAAMVRTGAERCEVW